MMKRRSMDVLRGASAFVLLGALSAADIACSSSKNGSVGDTSGTDVRCSGTAVPCASLSADQCAAAQGCVSGVCGGTPRECAAFTDNTSCILQQGCQWNGASSSCEGTPDACETFYALASCPGQVGCSWNDGCAGRAVSCDALNENACRAQPGCELVAAEDAGAEAGRPDGAADDSLGPMLDCSNPPDKSEIIDDMEDRSPQLSGSANYGAWFVFNDGTPGGTQEPAAGDSAFQTEPIPGGRCASEFAMRTTGTGFTNWGAGFGFNFGYGPNKPDGGPTILPTDGSAYEGIRFWARVGEGTATHIRVAISDVDTDPAGEKCIKWVGAGGDAAAPDGAAGSDASNGGAQSDASGSGSDAEALGDGSGADVMSGGDASGAGDADEVGDAGLADAAADGMASHDDANGITSSEGGSAGATLSTEDCYNHFGTDLELTTDWVEYKIPFSKLMQQDYGYRVKALLLDQLYGVQFSIPPSVTFDVWIDDIAWWKDSDL